MCIVLLCAVDGHERTYDAADKSVKDLFEEMYDYVYDLQLKDDKDGVDRTSSSTKK